MEGRLTRALAALGTVVLSAATPLPATDPVLDPRLSTAIAAAKAMMISDPRLALSSATQAWHLLPKGASREHDFALASLEWLEAEAYVRLNDAGRARPLVESAWAITMRTAPRSKLAGDLFVTRGGVDSLVSDPAKALSDYQTAYKTYLAIADERDCALALIDIADIYSYAKDYSHAIRYSLQATDTYREDSQLTFFNRDNLAMTYQEVGDHAAAAREAQNALKDAYRTRNTTLIGRGLQILAQIELSRGNLTEADALISRASQLQHRTAGGDDARLVGIAAQAAFQHGRLAEATTLIERSFGSIDLRHTTLLFRERHQTAYNIYRHSGNAAKALVHLEALKRLDDEATRLATSTNAALMGARFDFANQELRIATMEKAQAIARARTQRTISIAIASATALIITMLLAALFAIRRSRDVVRLTSRELARTNEALEGALKIKTEFLATTSHEIRTPLNGILGMTQVMLADATLAPAVRERVGVVHQAGETMRGLVDDILDIAKLETGKMRVEMRGTDLRATLRDLSRLWEEQAQAKGLGYVIDLDRGPAFALADATRLRQIVNNLLSNAVKFTPSGEVTLRAEVVGGPEPRYRVVIGDTGVGIAPENQALVFESFRQADASTTRLFGGTGLGLAICRQLARAMGGDVQLSSERGVGSTFTLDLPLYEVADDRAQEDAPAYLVVEANPIARATYRALLTPHVPALAFAASAVEAIARIEQGGIFRVLADERALAIDSGSFKGLDELLAASRKSSVPVTLLWTPNNGTANQIEHRAISCNIIRKPIAKSILVRQLFGNLDQPVPGLVSRAA